MNTDALLSLEFPVFTAENPAPERPVMSVEEWIVWLEEARKLQSREAFEARASHPSLRLFELGVEIAHDDPPAQASKSRFPVIRVPSAS